MSEGKFDDMLAELEKSISRLADGTAPLEDLVTAHQEAQRLLTEAQLRLAELKARADETAKSLSE